MNRQLGLNRQWRRRRLEQASGRNPPGSDYPSVRFNMQNHMMSYDLPEELIVEIFTRLPTKSILRFRSVSKSLCACIGSHAFIRLQTLHAQKKVMILHKVRYEGATCSNHKYTLHSQDQLPNDSLDFDRTVVEHPFRKYSIVGSCNGIICVYEVGLGMSLWNPSIRRKVNVHSRLPRSDHIKLYPLGFGFDPILDDYKILTNALYIEQGVATFTFVYTMKTDTWREIVSPTPRYKYPMSCQCLFNGALHWVVTRNSNGFVEDHHYYILTFDLSSEVFSYIELPKPSWPTIQVAIIKGSLAVISLKDVDCWIWVRNNTAASWSLAFKLNTNEFKGVQRVFQRTANDDELFNPFLSGITIHYNESWTPSRFVGSSGCWKVRLLTPCVESLALLDTGTSCDQGTRESEVMQI